MLGLLNHELSVIYTTRDIVSVVPSKMSSASALAIAGRAKGLPGADMAAELVMETAQLAKALAFPRVAAGLGWTKSARYALETPPIKLLAETPHFPTHEMFRTNVGGHHVGHTIVEVNIVAEYSLVDPRNTDALSSFDMT